MSRAMRRARSACATAARSRRAARRHRAAGRSPSRRSSRIASAAIASAGRRRAGASRGWGTDEALRDRARRPPLVVDVPHAGTLVPDAVAARLTRPRGRCPTPTGTSRSSTISRASRRHADGARRIRATSSTSTATLPAPRCIAGADNTELCPTRTFADEPIYAPGRRARLRTKCAAHGDVLRAVPRKRSRPRSSACARAMATRSCSTAIRSAARCRAFSRAACPISISAPRRRELRAGAAGARRLRARAAPPGSRTVVNGRFKGGWITRHYGGPARGVHALQLEIAQRCYMDEAPPYPWDADARGAARGAARAARRGAARDPSRASTMIRFYIARSATTRSSSRTGSTQAGIRAHVFNEHASSIVGDVPPDVAQPQVWLDAMRPGAGRHGAARLSGGAQSRRQHHLREMRRRESGDVRAVLEVRVVALADLIVCGRLKRGHPRLELSCCSHRRLRIQIIRLSPRKRDDIETPETGVDDHVTRLSGAITSADFDVLHQLVGDTNTCRAWRRQ